MRVAHSSRMATGPKKKPAARSTKRAGASRSAPNPFSSGAKASKPKQPKKAQPSAVDEGAARPPMRATVKRADGTEKARLSVYLDIPVALKLRRYCFEH